MKNPTTTELQWRVEALERKIAALADALAFTAAHLAHQSPMHAAALSQQLQDLSQLDDAAWTKEFADLVDQMKKALDGQALRLDSLK